MKAAPLVLILGWYGCSEGQLKRFKALYHDLGLESQCVILPEFQFFEFDQGRQKDLAEEILGPVQDQKLLIHSISNNGFALLQHLIAKPDQVLGVVLDSAPGPWHWPTYLGYPSRSALHVEHSTFAPYSFFQVDDPKYTWTQKISRTFRVARAFRTNWARYHLEYQSPGHFFVRNRVDFPLLFLYSASDIYMPSQYIDYLIEHLKTKQVTVVAKKFEGSGHVAHLKVHPDEYKAEVGTFKPAVVILGFYGSHPNQLAGYIDLYNNLGYKTLTYNLPKPMGWRALEGDQSMYFALLGYMLLHKMEGKSMADCLKGAKQVYEKLKPNWEIHSETHKSPGHHMITEKETFPILFLYSKKDRLIPYTFIEKLLELQASSGRRVIAHDFHESSHVAHLKSFPDKYREVVREFMRECKQ
eukprot:maker-scaffold266_size231069-snap-gene-0.16 protein:Tk11998 transcript:maker-scaffold266_size231069-snap-gene-0.16-mRNA-1 annotation:"GL21136"